MALLSSVGSSELEDDKIKVSSTKIRRAIGDGKYEAYGRPVKLIVNQYLSTLVHKISQGYDGVWSLLLETGELLSVRALLDGCCTARPDTILIPNPDQDECDQMLACFPGLKVFPIPSHTLIHMLSCKSTLYENLKTNGWEGFSYVWLDYCGTLRSRAGRLRQNDIRELFCSQLMNMKGCVLAVTFSQRGEASLYPNELIDSVAALISQQAEGSRYDASIVGVFSYANERRIVKKKSSDRIYTIVALVANQNENNNIGTLIRMIEAPACEDEIEYTFYCGKWKVLGNISQSSPLLQVLEFSSKQFSTYCVKKKKMNPHARIRALVLDNKLLTVSRSLSIECNNDADIEAYIQDEKDFFLANQVNLHFKTNDTISINKKVRPDDSISWICEVIKSKVEVEKKKYDAIWLDYSLASPLTGRQLRELVLSGSLRDVAFVFKEHMLNERTNSIFGIQLNYCPTGEYWKDSEIDWIIKGVQNAATSAGYDSLDVLEVIPFIARSPSVCIIFSLRKMSACDSVSIDQIHLAGLRRHPGWNFPRHVHPGPSSKKYQRIWSYIRFMIRIHNLTSIAIHEPGFNHITPYLLEDERCANIRCLTGGDQCQHEIIRHRGWIQKYSQLQIFDSLPYKAGDDALLLFDEIGIKFWKIDWWPSVQQWFDKIKAKVAGENKWFVLIFMINIASKKEEAQIILEANIEKAANEHGLRMAFNSQAIVRNCGLPSLLMTYVFFGKDSTVEFYPEDMRTCVESFSVIN